MQHPFPYDPAWQAKYRDMIATPAEAVGRLRAGNRVFVGTGCGTPALLVEALVKRAHELADVEIIHLLTMGDAPYADRALTEHFLVNSFFIGANIRSHIQEGLGDYTPIMLIDIPHLFDSGQIPLDAVLIQVTPPDVNGKVSLGISVDIVRSAAENGSLIIAQVNPRMPRTMGDSFLDVADLDVGQLVGALDERFDEERRGAAAGADEDAIAGAQPAHRLGGRGDHVAVLLLPGRVIRKGVLHGYLSGSEGT